MPITSGLFQDAGCVSFLRDFEIWMDRADVTFLSPDHLQNIERNLTEFRNRAATADNKQPYLDALQQALEFAGEKFLSRELWPDPSYAPQEILFMSGLEAGVIRDTFPPGSPGRHDNLSSLFDMARRYEAKETAPQPKPTPVEAQAQKESFRVCTTYMRLKMRPHVTPNLDAS